METEASSHQNAQFQMISMKLINYWFKFKLVKDSRRFLLGRGRREMKECKRKPLLNRMRI